MYTTYHFKTDRIDIRDTMPYSVSDILKVAVEYRADTDLMCVLPGLTEHFFGNPYVVRSVGMTCSKMYLVMDYDPNINSLQKIKEQFDMVYQRLLEDKVYAFVDAVYVEDEMVRITFFDLPPIQQDFLAIDERLHITQRKCVIDNTLADL